jgi:hypothetical protein
MGVYPCVVITSTVSQGGGVEIRSRMKEYSNQISRISLILESHIRPPDSTKFHFFQKKKAI